MKPEETIDFHIRWAWAKIAKAYNAEAMKSDGSMAIGYVLLNIDKEGTPSTKLGPKMGMEPTSLTRLLKSMEELDLISRQTDKIDKRIVRVFLTSKGKAKREISKDVVLRFNEFIRANIDPKKLEVFFEVMTEMNQLLENNNVFEPENHLNHEKNN
ncbi:MAG: MarR family winged helix-turn-helix transcriptional regulator [Flavobacteriales bacterium]